MAWSPELGSYGKKKKKSPRNWGPPLALRGTWLQTPRRRTTAQAAPTPAASSATPPAGVGELLGNGTARLPFGGSKRPKSYKAFGDGWEPPSFVCGL